MKKMIYLWKQRGTSHCSWWIIRHVFWWHHQSFWELRVFDEILLPENGKLQKQIKYNQEILHFVLHGTLEFHSWEQVTSVGAGDVHCLSSWFESEYFIKNADSWQNLKYIECVLSSKEKNIIPFQDKNAFWISERRNNWHKQVENKEDVSTVHVRQDVIISRARIDSHTMLPYRKTFDSSKIFFFLLTWNLEIAGSNLHDRDAIEIIWNEDIIPIYWSELWWEIIAIELKI